MSTGSGGAQVAGGAGHTHTPRLGRRMARFNKHVLNKVTIHVAGRLPNMGIVIHVGRRTGNVYRTPVNVFGPRTGSGSRSPTAGTPSGCGTPCRSARCG